MARLVVELAHAVRGESAILDGEIACLDRDGRSNFHKLLFRREWPFFCAFDLLKLDGRDLRNLPLIERKVRLKSIMPNVGSRVRYVDHIEGSGKEFYRLRMTTISKGLWGSGSSAPIALTERRLPGSK